MPCYDSKQHLQTEVKQYIMHVDADTATNTGASSVSSLPLESVSERYNQRILAAPLLDLWGEYLGCATRRRTLKERCRNYQH